MTSHDAIEVRTRTVWRVRLSLIVPGGVCASEVEGVMLLEGREGERGT
jgi:hypothetical protein